METTILQACAAGASFAVAGTISFAIMRMFTAKKDAAEKARTHELHYSMYATQLRAAKAAEKAAHHLARIATQLEENGNNK